MDDPAMEPAGGVAPDHQPGDVRPAQRRLDRPPGERYAAEKPGVATPSLGRAAAWGGLAAALVALAWGALSGFLGLDLGLLVLAVFGGWLIGSAVLHGARVGRPARPETRFRVLAVLLAALTWPAAQAVAWVMTRVTLPASSLDLARRLAATSYGDYVANTFSPISLLAIGILVLAAWLTAR
jgi:hypothetical protein